MITSHIFLFSCWDLAGFLIEKTFGNLSLITLNFGNLFLSVCPNFSVFLFFGVMIKFVMGDGVCFHLDEFWFLFIFFFVLDEKRTERLWIEKRLPFQLLKPPISFEDDVFLDSSDNHATTSLIDIVKINPIFM